MVDIRLDRCGGLTVARMIARRARAPGPRV